MTVDAMATLDIGLRGASVVLTLMLAGLLARDLRERTVGRMGAAFALGVAAFAVWSAPNLAVRDSLLAIPLICFAAGNNIIFWLLARSLFDDDFREKPWHAGIWLAVAATAVAARDQNLSQAIDRLLALQAIAFATLAVVQTIRSWSDDLVEGRRRLRLVLVPMAAAYILANGWGHLSGHGSSSSPIWSLIGAAVLCAIALGSAWVMLDVVPGALWLPKRDDGPSEAALATLDSADRPLLVALEHALHFDRIYRQDRLSIAALARHLGTPEYRLRRLINQGLGHRNFSSFLNAYRLAEAEAALRDASQAKVSVLTIAMDCGFASLGPFNRAFRARSGMTPTQYRERGTDG